VKKLKQEVRLVPEDARWIHNSRFGRFGILFSAVAQSAFSIGRRRSGAIVKARPAIRRRFGAAGSSVDHVVTCAYGRFVQAGSPGSRCGRGRVCSMTMPRQQPRVRANQVTSRSRDPTGSDHLCAQRQISNSVTVSTTTDRVEFAARQCTCVSLLTLSP